MDNLPLFMIIRGFLSLLLICGGIYSLKKGFQLYLNGVGLQEEEVGVAANNGNVSVNITLKKVGTAVMLTSIVWASLSYIVMPKMITSFANGEFSTNIFPSEMCRKLGYTIPPET